MEYSGGPVSQVTECGFCEGGVIKQKGSIWYGETCPHCHGTGLAPGEARPLTAEEMREKFLATLRGYVAYWSIASVHTDTLEGRLNGLAFSFLNMLDGTSVALPAFNLVPQPHPDDAEFLRGEGENWWVSEPINDEVMLHELWYTSVPGSDGVY